MTSQLARSRLPVLVALVVLCATTAVAVLAGRPGSASGDDVVDALARHAHPLASTEPGGDLTDLGHLGDAVGDAVVVGFGESTHSSREFFTLKHRVFRYLVRELGFTTFGLETGWSTGLRLNRYVLHGEGNARQIMREEFPAFWVQPWRTEEYLDLIEWMRAYNEEQPDQPVQFLAFDTYYPADEVIDEVLGYVTRYHSELRDRVAEHYRHLRPTDLTTYMAENWNTPLAERRARAEHARLVLELLERQEPGPDPDRHAWAVQHARILSQTARLWAFDVEDPAAPAAAMEFRDRFMAENTVWWHEQTGGRILVSAHNGHVANQTLSPESNPVVQGTFLRQLLGDGYVSIGTSFHGGSFNAMEDTVISPDSSVGLRPQEFTLPAAAPGSHAHVLDQVRYEDYLLDLRTAPAELREWLDQPRPSRDIGSAWPVPEKIISLAASYDVVVHLHEITAARLLGPR